MRSLERLIDEVFADTTPVAVIGGALSGSALRALALDELPAHAPLPGAVWLGEPSTLRSELAAIRPHLAPGARLLLAHTAPSGALASVRAWLAPTRKPTDLVERLCGAALCAGFSAPELLHESPQVTAVLARVASVSFVA